MRRTTLFNEVYILKNVYGNRLFKDLRFKIACHVMDRVVTWVIIEIDCNPFSVFNEGQKCNNE